MSNERRETKEESLKRLLSYWKEQLIKAQNEQQTLDLLDDILKNTNEEPINGYYTKYFSYGGSSKRWDVTPRIEVLTKQIEYAETLLNKKEGDK